MSEHQDLAGEVRLAARDVLGDVDLVTLDEFRGPGPGLLIRESGLRFGIPLAYPVDPDGLPSWLRQRALAGPHRLVGLVFTFDLDELPIKHHYTTIQCAVELTGDEVIAVDLELDGAAAELIDRLKPPPTPTPRWLRSRLRQRVPPRQAATSGLRSGTFGCTYRDPTGEALMSRSYTMLAIVEVPAKARELTGGLTAEVEIARTVFGKVIRRTAATPATTGFTVRLPAPRQVMRSMSDAEGSGKHDWRIGFTVDITSYSDRPTQHEQENLQLRLVDVVKKSLEDARLPIDDKYTQQAGDALHVFLPPDVDIRRVPRLIQAAVDWLTRDNADHIDRMRWRMAMDNGSVAPAAAGFSGDAIISLCRLVESKELRLAIDDHPEADLALLVSDRIYNDIFRHDYPGVAAAEFRQVHVAVKGYTADAWLWISAKD
jgi:hypothetical protein